MLGLWDIQGEVLRRHLGIGTGPGDRGVEVVSTGAGPIDSGVNGFFFFKFILRERERGRGRENPKPAPHCQHRAATGSVEPDTGLNLTKP